jgi:phage terminase large subunit-like protein
MTSKLGFDDTMVFKVDSVDLDKPIQLDVDDDTQHLIELLETLEAKKEAEKLSGWVRWFIPGTPYGIENLPKHYAFFSASRDYQETYFSAANRCGKTIAGAFQTACHLLGEYPDWWPGRKFDKPTDGWAVGDNKETCRDIVQKELLGDIGKMGTGMIPADRIEKVVYRPNSGGAVDYVLVKHISGGTSRLGFKSSEQGIVSFYGTQKDFVWMDELPPADIYSEAYLRTMTTNGILYVTATPLAGLTPLVLSFYNNADFLPRGSEIPGIVKLSREDAEEQAKERLRRGEIDSIEKTEGTSKAVIIAGWDDAKWLTEDAKKRMLDATPPHLKESRSKGLPSMGSGTIYTIPLEEILVKDFDIPKHWKKIAGMDVGWNNTACIWLAENPDTKEVFAYSEYKRGQAEPLVHAAAIKGRGDWIPIAIDPASRGRSQVDGKQLFNMYRDLGLKLFPADNSVEAGIYQIQEMLATGRLKFFRSLSELAKEYVVYRRDQKGRIIKENDHIQDSLRYATQALKHAKQPPISRQGGQSLNGSGRKYDI